MKDLTIRRLRPSDAEALYRILSDRQVMRYLEPPYDRLQTEQFLREAKTMAKLDSIPEIVQVLDHLSLIHI